MKPAFFRVDQTWSVEDVFYMFKHMQLFTLGLYEKLVLIDDYRHLCCYVDNYRHTPLEEFSQKGSSQSERPTSTAPSLCQSYLLKVLKKDHIISDSHLMCLNFLEIIGKCFINLPINWSIIQLIHCNMVRSLQNGEIILIQIAPVATARDGAISIQATFQRRRWSFKLLKVPGFARFCFSPGDRAPGKGGFGLLAASHCLCGRDSRLSRRYNRSLDSFLQTPAQEQWGQT